jgi:hypothetical protein
MLNQVLTGYVYSFVTPWEKERLLMASFGTSRTKAKKALNTHNQQRLQPVKPHKRYVVQVAVVEEITA